MDDLYCIHGELSQAAHVDEQVLYHEQGVVWAHFDLQRAVAFQNSVPR